MNDPTARPALVLRVGVTGARHMAPERAARLRGPVDDVLALVAAEAARLAKTHQARRVYARGVADEVPVTLRMISPLAEGADRLAAESALALGYDLISPLPFTQADYEHDFPSTVDAFRHLLAKAQVIELDGGRGAAEALSYEAVGRFVVRNCDVLIALWDGGPAKGQGGTADIVRYSARSNVPIWWIDIESDETRFLASSSQWRGRDLAPRAAEARARLADYLLNLILPPVVAPPKRHGILGFVAHHYCRITDSNPHPVDVFLAEPPPRPTPVVWQLFSRVYRLLAAPSRALAPTPFQAPPDTERYWVSRFERADALSIFYGDRYRSSYVLVILLAFLAFAMSIAGAPFRRTIVEIGLELVIFAAIGALVFANHVLRWHERWLSYRLVAELCRNQVMLMPLGRSLAGVDINRLASDPSLEREHVVLPRDAWVSWYYLATLRAAPFDPLSASDAKRNAFAVARSLVAEQEAYHRFRHQRADKADHRLALYSDWFGGGLAAILGLVWLRTAFRLTVGIETVVTLFSGASAAFIGLRGYAEFALLAQQSLRMEIIMRDTAAELDDVDLEAPQSSQELGAILERLAGSMMQDVSGWAQLFRQTTPETS